MAAVMAGLLGPPPGPSQPSPLSLLPTSCSSWEGSVDSLPQPSDSFPPLQRCDLVKSPVPDATFLECSKRQEQSHGNMSVLHDSSPAQVDDEADRRQISMPKED